MAVRGIVESETSRGTGVWQIIVDPLQLFTQRTIEKSHGHD